MWPAKLKSQDLMMMVATVAESLIKVISFEETGLWLGLVLEGYSE